MQCMQVEDLQSQTKLRGTIHLTCWEVDAAELRTQHATHSLTELQLLHVTKELQVIIASSCALIYEVYRIPRWGGAAGTSLWACCVGI